MNIYITCPLLENERAVQDTHGLLGKLRKPWKEMVVSAALSICSVPCDIALIVHAELSVKIQVRVLCVV